jgi:hypothetical protein
MMPPLVFCSALTDSPPLYMCLTAASAKPMAAFFERIAMSLKYTMWCTLSTKSSSTCAPPRRHRRRARTPRSGRARRRGRGHGHGRGAPWRTHQIAAQLQGLEVRLPLRLDEALLRHALALQALLAVGRRLHPLRDDIVRHGLRASAPARAPAEPAPGPPRGAPRLRGPCAPLLATATTVHNGNGFVGKFGAEA